MERQLGEEATEGVRKLDIEKEPLVAQYHQNPVPARHDRLAYLGPCGACKTEQEVIDYFLDLKRRYWKAIQVGDTILARELGCKIEVVEWFDHDIWTLAMDIDQENRALWSEHSP
jgi:hypothetical protein